jgi:hypothetical protein
MNDHPKHIQGIIEALNEIEFHDLHVYGFSLFTDEETRFSLEIGPYNEISDEYDHITIDFRKVKKLKSSDLDFTQHSDLELTSFQYDYKNGFECELILLLGFSEPVMKIKLVCENIELKQRSRQE